MQKKQCSGEMCRKHTCSSRPRLNDNTRMLISTPLDSRDTAGVERHRLKDTDQPRLKQENEKRHREGSRTPFLDLMAFLLVVFWDSSMHLRKLRCVSRHF